MRNMFFGLLLVSAVFLSWACSNSTSSPASATPTPSGGSTPAVTLSAISSSGSYPYVYAIGSTALSAPITITHGQSIAWNSSNDSIHPLYLDNGSTCLISGSLSFPLTEVFSTTGTYYFHCSNHSSCTGTTCPAGTSCAGMAGSIVVQ